jgi:hypothetical protein
MAKTKEDVLRSSIISNQQDLVKKVQRANRRQTIVHRVPKPETLLGLTDEAQLRDVFFNQLRRCFNFTNVVVHFDSKPESFKLVERQLMQFDRPRSGQGEPWDSTNDGKDMLAKVLTDLFLQEKSAVSFRVSSSGVVGLFDSGKKFSRVRKANKEDVDSEARMITQVVDKYHERAIEKALTETRIRGLTDEKAKALLLRADTMTEAYRKKLESNANLSEIGEEVPSDTFSVWFEFTPTYSSEYNVIDRRH